MFRNIILSVALVAATVPPAAAGGTLSLTVNVTTAEEARAIRASLALYRIARGIESGAFVHQNGSFNRAALAQISGGRSVGVIHQEGNRHAARLEQQGRGQVHGIFQFGNGARADVTQTRHGQSGLTLQFGFD